MSEYIQMFPTNTIPTNKSKDKLRCFCKRRNKNKLPMIRQRGSLCLDTIYIAKSKRRRHFNHILHIVTTFLTQVTQLHWRN